MTSAPALSPVRIPRVRPLHHEPRVHEPPHHAARGHELGPRAAGTQLALVTDPPVEPPLDLPVQRTLEDATARRHAQDVLRMAVEVVDGRRPAAHVARHVSPSVLRYLIAAAGRPDLRAPTASRTAPPASDGARSGAARLCSLRLDQPHPGAAEVAVVCRFGNRARALAARFDLRDGRWRCTALRLG